MARPKKTKPPPLPPPPASSPAAAKADASLGEVLLLATVCMVGLHVEVQVRDGSTYAGVFHTACVDGGYGVVLKKARKIANGKDNTNLALGAFVDTLVILPEDLVQVIAKDYAFPTKGIGRIIECDVGAANGSVKPQTSIVKDPKLLTVETVPLSRQVEKCSGLCEEHEVSIKKNVPVNCNAVCSGSPTRHIEELHAAAVGLQGGSATNSVSITATLVSDVKGPRPATSVAKVDISSKTTAKVSKLNPCAKVFSPSFTSFRPVSAAALPGKTTYISNSFPEVPTGVPVFEINSAPSCSSLPSKAVPYNNMVPVNYGTLPHYVQPIMGHNVARLEPVRFGNPYQPVQLAPSYMSPSPQPAMTEKFRPVVYVHPVYQDAIQGTPVSLQGWSRPSLSNPYQTSLQKFQGTAPIYVAPPVMATGNTPLVVPNPAPVVQPFPALHPIMVPAGTGNIPGKYL